MAWGRLDDGFDEHAKTLALLEHERGVEAIGLWTLCLAYAHRSRRKGKTAGHLPVGLLRRYVGRDGAELAALLVEVNYWAASDEGGWVIVNFAEYLPTEKTSEARSIAGRKGAEKRWGKEPEPDGSEPSPDGKLPSASHGADGNAVANDGSRADAGARSHSHSHTQETKKTSSSSSAQPKTTNRGTRLPNTFVVDDGLKDWFRQNCPGVDGAREHQKFLNHWSAATGSNAVKRDWRAAWRNWMLNALDRVPSGTNGSRPTNPSVGRNHQQ